ncbi:hypothetical protein SAMN05720471_1483 [Fibrobacter sp. UWP2]|nr:hypothetical protein SAMN05720471_1483 [Fibrobacter sp. UWP2]
MSAFNSKIVAGSSSPVALGIATPWGEDLRAFLFDVQGSKASFYEVVRERPKIFGAGEAKRDDENFCYVGVWESVSYKRLV